MTEQIVIEIISNPESFINEIVKNHGIDSMQYIMAINVVNEVKLQLSQPKGERS